MTGGVTFWCARGVSPNRVRKARIARPKKVVDAKRVDDELARGLAALLDSALLATTSESSTGMPAFATEVGAMPRPDEGSNLTIGGVLGFALNWENGRAEVDLVVSMVLDLNPNWKGANK